MRRAVQLAALLVLLILGAEAKAAPPPITLFTRTRIEMLGRFPNITFLALPQGSIGGGGSSAANPVFVTCVSGCGGSGGTSSTFGSAFPSTGTAIGVKNGSNMVNLAADASSNLFVNCAVGCSASAGFSDNTAFTAGTTTINLTGGWYSTSPTNCTTGNGCAPQLTIDRKLFVQDFQGTSPWVVSASGGTFAVTQSTSPWVDNVTQWASTALGAPSNYGTSPGAVEVPGVNAFITNAPNIGTVTTLTGITNNVNVVGTTADGSTTETPLLVVGGETNDATAQYQPIPEGAGGRSVIVEGVTGGTAIPVSGTFFQTTQPVSCTAANCAINLAQEAGTAITNTPTAIGTLGSGNVISVNMDLTSEHGTAVTNTPTAIGTLGSGNVISANLDLTSEHGTAVTNVPTAIGTLGSGNVITTNGDLTSEHGTAITTVPVAFGSGTPSGNAPGVNSALFYGTVAAAGDPCQLNAQIAVAINEATSSLTTIITGTSAKKTYICSINLVTATAQNINFVAGTGTNCATTVHVGFFGGTTAATGWNFAANGGLTIGGGGYHVAGGTDTAADNICYTSSSTGQVSGTITYVQQ